MRACLTLSASRHRAGTCTLVDLDGPFVTLRLMGRFWHPRGMVLARVGQFLQTRIPVRANHGRGASPALLTASFAAVRLAGGC